MSKVLVSALEPSANIHLKEILSFIDEIELVGIFSEEFGTPLYSSKEFAVMGIIDALKKYFKAKEAIKELLFLSKDVDKVILIDAPSFNIPLARAIRELNPNIEIIYYILPKVWIWKKYRAALVEKYASTVISIFPFEKRFYPNSQYFGNPIYNQIKEYKNSLTSNNKIAFLAGSRSSEIKALMPIFRQMSQVLKDYELLLSIPSHFNDKEIKELYEDISAFKVYKDSHQCVSESSFAYVCSGTATLEVAMIGTPFVLVYKAKKIDYFLIGLFANLQFVGLANIIFDYENRGVFHEEILQNSVNSKNLLLKLNSINRDTFLKNSKLLRDILKGNTSKEVARLLI